MEYMTAKSGPVAPVLASVADLERHIEALQRPYNVIVGLFRGYDETLPYEVRYISKFIC